MNFDPNGDSQNMTIVKNPVSALSANSDADKAIADTAAKFPPPQSTHNNSADAFRHTDFSVRMTRSIGAEQAKKIGDAHERFPGNPRGERMMDLMNNNTGRVISNIFPNMSPSALSGTALDADILQTAPVEIQDGR